MVSLSHTLIHPTHHDTPVSTKHLRLCQRSIELLSDAQDLAQRYGVGRWATQQALDEDEAQVERRHFVAGKQLVDSAKATTARIAGSVASVLPRRSQAKRDESHSKSSAMRRLGRRIAEAMASPLSRRSARQHTPASAEASGVRHAWQRIKSVVVPKSFRKPEARVPSPPAEEADEQHGREGDGNNSNHRGDKPQH